MRLFAISNITSGKETIGFRILDVDTKDVKDVPIGNIYKVIKSKKACIANLEVKGKQVVGSNGSIDRLPEIVHGKLIGKSPIIIIDKIGNEGYTVADFKGSILRLKEADVIKYAKENGISNGKVVNKGGTEYISAIERNYGFNEVLVEQIGDKKVMTIPSLTVNGNLFCAVMKEEGKVTLRPYADGISGMSLLGEINEKRELVKEDLYESIETVKNFNKHMGMQLKVDIVVEGNGDDDIVELMDYEELYGHDLAAVWALVCYAIVKNGGKITFIEEENIGCKLKNISNVYNMLEKMGFYVKMFGLKESLFEYVGTKLEGGAIKHEIEDMQTRQRAVHGEVRLSELMRAGAIEESKKTGSARQTILFNTVQTIIESECKKQGLNVEYVRQAKDKDEVDISINGIKSIAQIISDPEYPEDDCIEFIGFDRSNKEQSHDECFYYSEHLEGLKEYIEDYIVDISKE